jgi:hypothetical protein
VSVAKFKLDDCQGVSHEYEVTRFPVDENARLQLLLGEPLIKAVARAIGVLAPVIKEGGLADAMEEGTLQSLAGALSGANWSIAADVLTPLPRMILDQGGPALIAQIFAKTVRKVPIDAMRDQPAPVLSEDQPVGNCMRQELGNAAHRELAFGDGNMGEYWKAAAMVLVANFTPTGPDGSVSWKQAAESMTGGLLML